MFLWLLLSCCQQEQRGTHWAHFISFCQKEKRKMPGVPNGNICHIEPEPHGGHSGPELERTGR